jgi:hypothetical protein
MVSFSATALTLTWNFSVMQEPFLESQIGRQANLIPIDLVVLSRERTTRKMKPICLKLTRATTVKKGRKRRRSKARKSNKKSLKVTKKSDREKLIRNFLLREGVIDETAPPSVEK